MSGAKNILVIGETGVGKSSVVNLIIGNDVAPFSRTAERVTFSVNRYPYENYFLVDTVGYNDANEKNPTEALVNLAKFVMGVKDEGISLIIYVMRKGRITKASRTNYDYFVKTVCEDKVPVLLVVTHCEHDSAQETWYSLEKDIITEFKMKFAGDVCGSAVNVQNPNLDPDFVPILTRKREKTREALRNKIGELVLGEPWKPSDGTEWFGKVFWGALTFFGIAASVFVAALPTIKGILGPAATEAVKLVMSSSKK